MDSNWDIASRLNNSYAQHSRWILLGFVRTYIPITIKFMTPAALKCKLACNQFALIKLMLSCRSRDGERSLMLLCMCNGMQVLQTKHITCQQRTFPLKKDLRLRIFNSSVGYQNFNYLTGEIQRFHFFFKKGLHKRLAKLCFLNV